MTDQPNRPALEVDGTTASRSDGQRLLLTNDDGIDSPGLHALARALSGDHDVIVAAPAVDVSGAGTSMGALDAAEPTRLHRQDFDGIEAYGIEGPPGLAVLAASLGAFGPRPDVVVSGPNRGLNTGSSIIHSGTVGAALTGRTFGSKAIAVSIAPGDRWYWETAAAIAVPVVAWVLARDEPTTLNVNVPALPVDRIVGVRWAKIDGFGHFSVATQGEGGTVLDLDVRDRSSGTDPDSDTALCLSGHVTLTLLTHLAAEPVPQDVDPGEVVPLPDTSRTGREPPEQAGT
ncbi:MAG: 5'/3'-nucleotidase SurE [Nitriliruptoraceae bacterium]